MLYGVNVVEIIVSTFLDIKAHHHNIHIMVDEIAIIIGGSLTIVFNDQSDSNWALLQRPIRLE